MPKTAKCTRGPLMLHQGDDYLEVFQNTRGTVRIIYQVRYPDDEDVANAKFFIAAHDMAEALRELIKFIPLDNETIAVAVWMEKGKDALAKAGV